MQKRRSTGDIYGENRRAGGSVARLIKARWFITELEPQAAYGSTKENITQERTEAENWIM